MQLSELVPSNVITKLQNTIQYPDELCAWFTDNLNIFGLSMGDSEDFTEVTCKYAISRIIKHPGDTPYINIAFQLRLPVGVEYSSDKIPYSYHRIYQGQHEALIDMQFDLDAWPFIAARLAAHAIDELVSHPDEPLPKFIQDALETYIPLHFPGLTWAKVQNLHAASLLPTNMHGFMDERFSQMLFTTRHAQPRVELPNAIEL